MGSQAKRPSMFASNLRYVTIPSSAMLSTQNVTVTEVGGEPRLCGNAATLFSYD